MNTDGVWISFTKPEISEFTKYQALVHKLTEEQPLHELENIEKRGFTDHHIDHKTSIWYGWKNGIPAEEIAHISNLRVIPCKENLLKGRACIN
jgi:hypothetical protein